MPKSIAIRGFAEDVKEFGQDTFREEIGTIKFNDLMRLDRVREEQF